MTKVRCNYCKKIAKKVHTFLPKGKRVNGIMCNNKYCGILHFEEAVPCNLYSKIKLG